MNASTPSLTSSSLTSSVRRFVAPPVLAGALVVAVALATLAQGIIGGTTWVLLVGLTATAVVLAVLGRLADSGHGPGVASGLRSGGPGRPSWTGSGRAASSSSI